MRAGAEAQLAAADDAIERQVASRRTTNRQDLRTGYGQRAAVGDAQTVDADVGGADVWLIANVWNNHIVDCRIGDTRRVWRTASRLRPVGGCIPVRTGNAVPGH